MAAKRLVQIKLKEYAYTLVSEYMLRDYLVVCIFFSCVFALLIPRNLFLKALS